MKYIISDIHGHFDLFVSLMRKIGFSNDDQLYVCGDIIEKGPDSVKLLKLISTLPNTYCIVGNHEEAFLEYYYYLMQEINDYDLVLKMMRDYLQGDGNLLDFELIEWIESLPYYIETEDFICVHAGVLLDKNNKILPLRNMPKEELLYSRKFKNPEVLPLNSKCVFYGHTHTSSVNSDGSYDVIEYLNDPTRPRTIENYAKVHMDTGVFASGVLACFCVDTCQVHYIGRDNKV